MFERFYKRVAVFRTAVYRKRIALLVKQEKVVAVIYYTGNLIDITDLRTFVSEDEEGFGK